MDKDTLVEVEKVLAQAVGRRDGLQHALRFVRGAIAEIDGRSPLTDAEVKALIAERDALKKENEELKKEKPPVP